ncbi:TetR/AcrR family transcriptional regulator [Aeromicrobium sp. CF3.5]|uniref:TetR/AcrR family transcriptional regulator n=1 Tax=Aeromicrobium sp. CF3.5 TaxID=3373078 RepID=UPI003EE78970
MPRQSKEEIDAEIVDSASALFAQHGYRHTSLQQVADATGYSKAGLLHRFSSKEAIYDAAVRSALVRTTALAADTAGIAQGAERDRVLVDALLDASVDWPGTAAFLQSVVTSDPQGASDELSQAGAALVGAFGLDANNVSDEALVRLIIATAGLQASASAAARLGRTEAWRPHIVATAMEALGHSGAPQAAVRASARST